MRNNHTSFVLGNNEDVVYNELTSQNEDVEKRIVVDNVASIIAYVSLMRIRIRNQSPWQSCIEALISGLLKKAMRLNQTRLISLCEHRSSDLVENEVVKSDGSFGHGKDRYSPTMNVLNSAIYIAGKRHE